MVSLDWLIRGPGDVVDDATPELSDELKIPGHDAS
jgi:hypothetical protein